jgi:LAS superfamily LD-carboxypeptidase LdcB
MSLTFSVDELTGRSRSHIVDLENPRCALHREVVAPFLAMRAAAASQGMDLVPFSSFRDFDRQLAIWNAKASGERELLGADGLPLDVEAMDEPAMVAAILLWSALPGASRHHWGTDFDVMDAKALPAGYKLQVIPAEYLAGGPFERLTRWLDEHMHAFGFFRPYHTDRGGVSPEPWHLSYAPVAAQAQSAFSLDGLRGVLAAAAIDGKEAVLAALPRTFASYVANVDAAPGVALASPRLS